MEDKEKTFTPEELEIKRKSRVRLFCLLVGIDLLLLGCLVYSVIEMVSNFK
ncbi:MAG: hypothetical protein IJQ67_05785 [Bacilli bacterium]|nr:hypothetical protein [Bacilli bacterium]